MCMCSESRAQCPVVGLCVKGTLCCTVRHTYTITRTYILAHMRLETLEVTELWQNALISSQGTEGVARQEWISDSTLTQAWWNQRACFHIQWEAWYSTWSELHWSGMPRNMSVWNKQCDKYIPMSTSVSSASEKERKSRLHATKTECISYQPDKGTDRVTSLGGRKWKMKEEGHNSR